MAGLKELRPVIVRDAWFDKIEEEIRSSLRKKIYEPIVPYVFLPKSSLKNEIEMLKAALDKGIVTYHRGVFSGKFSSGISRDLKKLGARWVMKGKAFRLPISDLPQGIKGAISASGSKFQQKLTEIDRHLQQILPEQIAEQLSFADSFDKTIWRVDKDFTENVKGIAFQPEMTAFEREKLSKEWEKNLRLYVEDFTKSEIFELREKVKQSAFAGNRYEALTNGIQRSYGVTVNKAKFLARQETKLLVTKLQEGRYTEAGLPEYKWANVSGSAEHPVRPRHRELGDASRNGATFKWASPPVTTEPGEAERHNNPGGDYNCRCHAIPVVRF